MPVDSREVRRDDALLDFLAAWRADVESEPLPEIPLREPPLPARRRRWWWRWWR